MGYTHYWKGTGFTTEQWDALRAHTLAIIVKAAERGIMVADGFGENSPVVDGKHIWLNGVGFDSHETFRLTPSATGFEFCKTNCKPYDQVVTAILIVAAYLNPEFEPSSDGEEWDWQDGLTLASNATGINDLQVPALVRCVA